MRPDNTGVSLVRIYRRLPELECKGLCSESCGPIIIGDEEEKRIVAKYGSAPTWDEKTHTCSMLQDRRCTIYPDRPLLCRMWGAVEGMPCVFGCVPKGGRMPDKKARKLMRAIYD